MEKKVKVSVNLSWDENGIKHPTEIVLDERVYPIDKVLAVRNSASLRTGGFGERYTIRICSKQYFLFFEEPFWWLLKDENN